MRIFNKMKKTMLVLAASLFAVNVAFAEEKTGIYSITASDVIESGQKVTSVEGLTITFGADTWTTGSSKVTYGDVTYNDYVSTSTSPSPNSGNIPTAGCYVALTT